MRRMSLAQMALKWKEVLERVLLLRVAVAVIEEEEEAEVVVTEIEATDTTISR